MLRQKELASERSQNRDQAAGTVVNSAFGPLWITGWLFTLGYAQLAWWKAILGLAIWPYFLGVALI